jgi:hypothetical protein
MHLTIVRRDHCSDYFMSDADCSWRKRIYHSAAQAQDALAGLQIAHAKDARRPRTYPPHLIFPEPGAVVPKEKGGWTPAGPSAVRAPSMLHMACSLARTHALAHARTQLRGTFYPAVFEARRARARASPLLDRSLGGKCDRTQFRIAHGS